jgi:hypothetical protein
MNPILPNGVYSKKKVLVVEFIKMTGTLKVVVFLFLLGRKYWRGKQLLS